MKQHIFLHVPKTAGSSIRTLLQQNYPLDATIGFSGDPDAIAWYRSRNSDFKKRHRLVHGHFHFGIHEGVSDYTYFTLLRDPVARHFSDYDFLRRYQPHPTHNEIVTGRLTPLDWAGIFERKPMYRNITTQYVSGDRIGHNVDRLSLERAKLHIRREFSFVGLAERFDESVLILARRLGWRSIFYLKRNVTADRVEVTESMRAEALNGLQRDAELYEFGLRLFESSPELKDSRFQDALLEFREARNWLEQHVANNPNDLFVIGEELPSLSVIVRAHRSTPALDRYLHSATEQAA